MANILQSWPEPVVRVQHLAESGIRTIPDGFIKKPSDRADLTGSLPGGELAIPVIDMQGLYSDDASVRRETAAAIHSACKEWGFFQLVNHGVSRQLMDWSKEVWRGFFRLPLEEKQKYANEPTTYEGYGSRLGVEKGISLDWVDYFFLHYSPETAPNLNNWPELVRETVPEYSEQLLQLSNKLLTTFSVNLGLPDDFLAEAFRGGGDSTAACMRVNYYPKCPQPDLTLGLSPHSDPGGLTLLFPDPDVVPGLQVRHGGAWITVVPLPGAFIVNLADQIQILTNGIYRSVEHRVVANAGSERLSLAYFVNPRGDAVIQPAELLVAATGAEPLYPATTFDEYRKYVRVKGTQGKAQVDSFTKK